MSWVSWVRPRLIAFWRRDSGGMVAGEQGADGRRAQVIEDQGCEHKERGPKMRKVAKQDRRAPNLETKTTK